MNRALAGLCLAVLAATAGCSSPGGPGTTVTPAPVPDPGAGEFAPGLTERGVVDPGVLANAHAEVLAGRSFTSVYNRTVYYDGRTVSYTNSRATVAPPDRYRIRTVEGSAFGQQRRRVLVATGEEARLVVVTGDDHSVNRTVTGDPVSAVDIAPRQRDRLTALFDIVAVGRVEPRREGAPAYRLSGTSVVDRSRLVSSRDRLLNVSLTATVEPSGLVRSYAFRYAFVRGRTNVTVVERYRVDAIGSTTVRTDLPVPNGTTTTGERTTTASPGDSTTVPRATSRLVWFGKSRPQQPPTTVQAAGTHSYFTCGPVMKLDPVLCLSRQMGCCVPSSTAWTVT